MASCHSRRTLALRFAHGIPRAPIPDRAHPRPALRVPDGPLSITYFTSAAARALQLYRRDAAAAKPKLLGSTNLGDAMALGACRCAGIPTLFDLSKSGKAAEKCPG